MTRMKGKSKKSSGEESTSVIKMGMEYFTTQDTPIEMIESKDMDFGEEKKTKTSKKDKTKKDGRFYKFVKKHILPRKANSNDVKEIHIVPDGDELLWARRSAGSAASRSSSGTANSDRLETVHDMAEEYVQEDEDDDVDEVYDVTDEV